MVVQAKKIATKKPPRVSISRRVADLESHLSDVIAHIAELDSRINGLKKNSYKPLNKRVENLESYTSDMRACIADIEERIEALRKRVRRSERQLAQ